MQCEKEGYLKFIPRKLRPALRNFRLLNRDYGHFRTVRTAASVDTAGHPIPWYTYPAIEYVKQLDFTGCSLFEYGSGYSTLFYAARCGHITAVEDDRKWWKIIQPQAPENATILFAQAEEDYANAIHQEDRRYDVVIVDGSYRERCCEQVWDRLKETGLVILDNSDKLPECVATLKQHDFIQVDFVGFGPLNGYLWATSFFFRRGFNIPSLPRHQPTLSVGP
jgi:hypothetical protein